jgi:hypothetical protein
VGDFNESTYYMESLLGHPVFEVKISYFDWFHIIREIGYVIDYFLKLYIPKKFSTRELIKRAM